MALSVALELQQKAAQTAPAHRPNQEFEMDITAVEQLQPCG